MLYRQREGQTRNPDNGGCCLTRDSSSSAGRWAEERRVLKLVMSRKRFGVAINRVDDHDFACATRAASMIVSRASA